MSQTNQNSFTQSSHCESAMLFGNLSFTEKNSQNEKSNPQKKSPEFNKNSSLQNEKGNPNQTGGSSGNQGNHSSETHYKKNAQNPNEKPYPLPNNTPLRQEPNEIPSPVTPNEKKSSDGDSKFSKIKFR